MSWSLSRRCRPGRAAEDGALAVEAALIFPIILLLALGIVEWSLVLRDQVQVTSMARAAARTASALAPIQNPADPGVSSSTIPNQVFDAIQRATSSMPRGAVESIQVFTAASPSPAMSCSTSICDRYDWDPLDGTFRRIRNQWRNAPNIDSCLGASGMSVGVSLIVDHAMLTGIFGHSKSLSSTSVMRFEPQPPGRCGP